MNLHIRKRLEELVLCFRNAVPLFCLAKERKMNNENQLVYDVTDIQKILGLSRSKVYLWLEEVYKAKFPFRVIKIGKLYKIPKDSFDKWIEGNNES